jgi:two-component system NarL family sensor kinase
MTTTETVAAVRLDSSGRIADATIEAASMLGFKPATLVGRTLGELTTEKWRAMGDAATARILQGDNRSFQLLLRGRSGRETLVQMASQRVRRGDEDCYVLAWSEQPSSAPGDAWGTDAPELRRLANGLLHTRELERSRVSTQLHSGVVPLVVMSKFMIEVAMRRLADGEQAEGMTLLNGAIDRLRDVLGDVRRISTELRPSLLDDLGLLPTLEWLCRTFEQTCGTVAVDRKLIVAEREVPQHLKLPIFRIVEELLGNVARHANATRVDVRLERRSGQLRLSVRDDGDGFDARLLASGVLHLRGIGLQTIRERADDTGGRFEIESAPHRGTKAEAHWSLQPCEMV